MSLQPETFERRQQVFCVWDRTNIRDVLENHKENKNKDLPSTIREYMSLEYTPQVWYTILRNLDL